MKELKFQVIDLLEEDSRLSLKKLAAATGASEKEVSATVTELENEGVIIKYTTIVNRDSFEGVEAYIEVSVTPEKSKGFDAIAEEIVTYDEVESVYLMSGAYDLAVTVRGKTLKEVAMFVSERLSTLDNVIGTKTHFILKKYKIAGVITKKSHENREKVLL